MTKAEYLTKVLNEAETDFQLRAVIGFPFVVDPSVGFPFIVTEVTAEGGIVDDKGNYWEFPHFEKITAKDAERIRAKNAGIVLTK